MMKSGSCMSVSGRLFHDMLITSKFTLAELRPVSQLIKKY